MARAVLADRPVLLLDEPTAHLDIPTAGALMADLLELAHHRTTVVVTHRPAEMAGHRQVRIGPAAMEPGAPSDAGLVEAT